MKLHLSQGIQMRKGREEKRREQNEIIAKKEEEKF